MAMEATINHNQNAAECITHVNYWGKYIYYNICNGQTQEIPFGLLDYAGLATVVTMASAFILMLFAIFFFCIALLVLKVFDINDDYKRARQWRNRKTGGGEGSY